MITLHYYSVSHGKVKKRGDTYKIMKISALIMENSLHQHKFPKLVIRRFARNFLNGKFPC